MARRDRNAGTERGPETGPPVGDGEERVAAMRRFVDSDVAAAIVEAFARFSARRVVAEASSPSPEDRPHGCADIENSPGCSEDPD